MTIAEAIQQIDEFKPNNYSVEQKVRWLSDLDHRIHLEIHSKYDEDIEDFEPYTTDDMDTELLVCSPYDSLYVKYMQSMIDYYNEDFTRYNNASAVFQNEYRVYERYYNRTYVPLRAKVRWFG